MKLLVKFCESVSFFSVEYFMGRYVQRENVLRGKKTQNFRVLVLRMRSLEHFRRDKLSRLDVKSIKVCL